MEVPDRSPNPKIIMLGLPQDNNSSYLTGPSMSPMRIREAFFCDSANLFTETGVDLGDETLWADAGDVPLKLLVVDDQHPLSGAVEVGDCFNCVCNEKSSMTEEAACNFALVESAI